MKLPGDGPQDEAKIQPSLEDMQEARTRRLHFGEDRS